MILSTPSVAIQISFPTQLENGDTEQLAVVVRGRSLRERFDRFDLVYTGDYYRFGTFGDRSRAFRPDQTYTNNNLSLFAQKKLENGLNYEIQMTDRFTTDPALTIRDDVHITSFYTSLGRPNVWLLRAGDIYPNLSRYSFIRSAQGGLAQYNRDLGDNLVVRLSGVLGSVERAREAATLRRAAVGSAATLESRRVVRGRPSWTIGHRFAAASDQLGSVDNARSLPDLQVDVHTVAYTAQLPHGFNLNGENGWSKGTSDRRTLRYRNGYAWSTNINWIKPSPTPYVGIRRLAPFAAQAYWELVDPYFQSPLGNVAANQLRWGGLTNHRFNENIDWTLSFLRFEDNVRNQGLVTTASRTSNAVVNMRPFRLFGASPAWTDYLPGSVRDIRTKLDFRYNLRDASNNSVNQKIEDYIYQVLYMNWGWNFTGDYQFQIIDDDVVPSAEHRLQAYGIRMARSFLWREWNMRFFPTLGYRISRDRALITGTSTRLQTTNFGMAVNWEELSAMVNYTISDADKAPSGNDYVLKRVRTSLTYKPYLYPNFSGTLTYGYVDDDDELQSRSYRQTETRLAVSYIF